MPITSADAQKEQTTRSKLINGTSGDLQRLFTQPLKKQWPSLIN